MLDVPLINAGDGIGEHPTQALLDLYTLVSEHTRFINLVSCHLELPAHCLDAVCSRRVQHNEFADRGGEGIDGLTVTMVGDLKNGRTVHSLCKLLSHFQLGTLHLVSPESLRMPHSVLDGLQQRGIKFKEHQSLEEVMRETDVLYGEWARHLGCDSGSFYALR